MNDFLADGDEEEVEDDVPHHMFNQEHAASAQKDDEALAARYEMLAEEQQQSSGDDDASRYSDEGDGVQMPQEPQEESESEDDWVAGIRNKQRRSSKANGTTTPKSNGSRLRRMSGIRDNKKNDADSDASSEQSLEETISKKTPPASSSKRAILEDSDSD